MDYRKLFRSQYFTAAELEGEMEVTVDRVTVETVRNESGEDECPAVWFKEHPKPLVLNKTNAKRLAALHGNDTEGWVGKKITLRESVASLRGQEVPCVRLK